MVAFDRDSFDRDGFCVLRGALSASEIEGLRAVFIDMFGRTQTIASRVREMDRDQDGPSRQPEIFRPMQIEPALPRAPGFARLRAIAGEIAGRRMAYVFDHAICKMPHTDTITPMHQDQAYLSEGVELKTLNMWVPMQAANGENGTMEYLPGSHRAGLQAHGASGTAAAHLLEMETGQAPLFRVDLEPGDIAVHHPLTAHRAGPNRSDEPRYAWALHFGPHGRFAYLHPRHAINALAGKARRQLAR